MTVAQVVAYAVTAFFSGWCVGMAVKSVFRFWQEFF